MVIDENLKIKYVDNAKSKFLKSYNNIKTNNTPQVTFEEFIGKVVFMAENELENVDNVSKEIVHEKKVSIMRIKRRLFLDFVKNAFGEDIGIKKPNSEQVSQFYLKISKKNDLDITDLIYEDLFEAKTLYKLSKKTNKPDIFTTVYEVETLGEYGQIVLKEVYDWLVKDSYISEFKYFSNLTKAIEYLTKDINYFLCKTLNLQQKESSLIRMNMTPAEYNMCLPIDTTNRKIASTKKGNVLECLYVIDDNTEILTTINIRNLKKDITKQKVFNVFDNKIIKALIELSSPQGFFTTRTVVCDASELVSKIAKNPSSKVYEDVFDSIRKISSYQAQYYNKQNQNMITYDIYKAVITSKNEVSDKVSEGKKYDKKIIKVVFSEQYINALLEGAVFTLNEPVFKNNATYALVGPLQSQRYECMANSTIDEYIKLSYNGFFNRVLMLGKTNKSRNISGIEKSLNELKDNIMIIEDWSRNRDTFFVKFIPLKTDEQKCLLSAIEQYSQNGADIKLAYNLLTTLKK